MKRFFSLLFAIGIFIPTIGVNAARNRYSYQDHSGAIKSAIEQTLSSNTEIVTHYNFFTHHDNEEIINADINIVSKMNQDMMEVHEDVVFNFDFSPLVKFEQKMPHIAGTFTIGDDIIFDKNEQAIWFQFRDMNLTIEEDEEGSFAKKIGEGLFEPFKIFQNQYIHINSKRIEEKMLSVLNEFSPHEAEEIREVLDSFDFLEENPEKFIGEVFDALHNAGFIKITRNSRNIYTITLNKKAEEIKPEELMTILEILPFPHEINEKIKYIKKDVEKMTPEIQKQYAKIIDNIDLKIELEVKPRGITKIEGGIDVFFEYPRTEWDHETWEKIEISTHKVDLGLDFSGRMNPFYGNIEIPEESTIDLNKLFDGIITIYEMQMRQMQKWEEEWSKVNTIE